MIPMANNESLPPHIRRFILMSIDSVPHLEAVLLLRVNPNADWDLKAIARELFIGEKQAGEMMDNLVKAGFVSLNENALYSFQPASKKLRTVIAELSEFYAKNLIEVTNLIHSKINKQAQKFGDAFLWGDES